MWWHLAYPGLGAPWKAVLPSDFTSTKQLSKKVFKKGRISWNKTSPLPEAKLQGMAQDPLEVPVWCRRSIYHADAQRNDAAHGSRVTVFIARHFPYPAITSQTETTLPWPKACRAFCQPKKKNQSTWGLNPALSKTSTFQLIHSSKAKINP